MHGYAVHEVIYRNCEIYGLLAALKWPHSKHVLISKYFYICSITDVGDIVRHCHYVQNVPMFNCEIHCPCHGAEIKASYGGMINMAMY